MRIISGIAKGRSIEAPPGKHTRPTGSMVREAVFGMLGGSVEGAEVLDLFCGSGAMALEALSRGASHAIMIDNDPKACAIARSNAARLSFENCGIYRNDYQRALEILAKKGSRFDIVFIDPPYAQQDYYINAMRSIKRLGLMKQDGAAVCEHDKNQSISVAGFVLKKRSDYGSKSISIFTEEQQ